MKRRYRQASLGCVMALAWAMLCVSAAGEEPLRTMRYTARSAGEAADWQQDLRTQLFGLLHLRDLAGKSESLPLEVVLGDKEERTGYVLQELELRATPGRTFKAILAKPAHLTAPAPAVVCIHGHGGSRHTPFICTEKIYQCFGEALARKGYVVISTDVGRHEAQEPGRTVMGERLWNLMRCVDYLVSLPEVDAKRVGCAGLSLGGEMAMWLGAMDPRIAATVSAGFLTRMDQMEKNHCLCWKFDGLRALVDFPDIYSLIAPRALQCQNGRKEPKTQFTVPLAQDAMQEISLIYRDYGAPRKAELHVHDGGHEIDLEALLSFFDRQLR